MWVRSAPVARLRNQLLVLFAVCVGVVAAAAINTPAAGAASVGAASSAKGPAAVHVTATSRERKLARRRGGRVRIAWPARHGAKPPPGALLRWLAAQVGSRKSGKSSKARSSVSALASKELQAPGTDLEFRQTDPTQKLALVRSYDIPKDDSAYARLLNLSWTYDSAVAATAFVASGQKSQAEQLLDQLAAVQRVDGSIDFAFDVYTGATIPLLRTGTVAWVGLAAAQYDLKYKSDRYEKVAATAARWIGQQRVSDPANADVQLYRGGPDVKWTSTQHNIVTYYLLRTLAQGLGADPPPMETSTAVQAPEKRLPTPQAECVITLENGTSEAVFSYSNSSDVPTRVDRGSNNVVTPTDGGQPTVFMPGNQTAVFKVAFKSASSASWSLGGKTVTATSKSKVCPDTYKTVLPGELASQATLTAGAIKARMLKTDGKNTLFIEGSEDPVLPMDAQTLGMFLLRTVGDTTNLKKVYDGVQARFPITGARIVLSKEPSTYNMTYSSSSSFNGFRPYADAAAPNVLWMEGTSQMRLANVAIGAGVDTIDAATKAWIDITKSRKEGLLQSNATAANDFNEYHVWPAAAATSWYLLSQSKLTEVPFTR